jgi:hypothetical protein
MSSSRAIPDSNPTRTQLRLVVLGQWVRAGLDLARGAGGVIDGALALWRVFQAIRLAMQLVQRLSDARGALAFAAPETAPETALGEAPIWDHASDDPAGSAAFLRDALIELGGMMRNALGLAPDLRRRSDAGEPASTITPPEPPSPLGRLQPPRGRPPDRPPPLERLSARRSRPSTPHALKTQKTPIAALAIGRFRLAAD